MRSHNISGFILLIDAINAVVDTTILPFQAHRRVKGMRKRKSDDTIWGFISIEHYSLIVNCDDLPVSLMIYRHHFIVVLCAMTT